MAVNERATREGNTGSPLLDVWEAEIDASLFGAGANAIVFVASFALRKSALAYTAFHQAITLVALALGVAGCMWACRYYPSLFSAKPRVSVPRVACALNGLFGGPFVFYFMNMALSSAAREKSYSADSWRFDPGKRKLYSAPGAAALVINIALSLAECFMLLAAVMWI